MCRSARFETERILGLRPPEFVFGTYFDRSAAGQRARCLRYNLMRAPISGGYFAAVSFTPISSKSPSTIWIISLSTTRFFEIASFN